MYTIISIACCRFHFTGLNEASFALIPPPLPLQISIDLMGKVAAERALTQGTLFMAGIFVTCALI